MMTSPSTYRALSFLQNNLALLLLTLAIVIVDRVVKFYVSDNLALGESIPVLGSLLAITHSENAGAAFGILQGFQWVFVIAALLVFALVVIFYNRIIHDRLLIFVAAFLLAGTVGNMMDRIFFLRVFDYIDFMYLPTFNISDMSLTAGAVLLIIYLLKGGPKEEEDDKTLAYAHY
jgi:signal peptidase II